MNRWLKLFAVIWLAGGPLLSARAWNAEGHKIVAQIAYNHLNPVAKARCAALIAIALTNSTAPPAIL